MDEDAKIKMYNQVLLKIIKIDLTNPPIANPETQSEELPEKNKEMKWDRDEENYIEHLIISNVAIETVGQASNIKWAKYRHLRLTSSNFGPIISAHKRNSFPPSLFKKLNCLYKLDKVMQVQWGIQNEKTAVSAFENATKLSVESSGFWLHPSGLLGASPDGLIKVSDGCLKLLEVKCPYTYRNDVLQEKLKGVRNYILCIENGVYKINKSHDYYHQMQGQMAILNASSTYLVLWTLKSTIIFEVYKDDDWNHLDMLVDFYVEKWVPYLICDS
nr:uncharacterized protein LOC107456093 [Parasteatoda tepidariorum]